MGLLLDLAFGGCFTGTVQGDREINDHPFDSGRNDHVFRRSPGEGFRPPLLPVCYL